jgi:hypothetical protein
MNRFTHTLVRCSAVAALALGSLAATSAGFAGSQPAPVTVADLLAQADHHAMMAADYRAHMRTDAKRAIVWFTQANHCDIKAERFRAAAAALQASAQPSIAH